MGWRSQRANRRALACLAVLSVGGGGGLLAGFSADLVRTSELSPAQVVALRFPADSSRLDSTPLAASPAAADIDASPAPARYVLASAGEEGLSGLMFNPSPTYTSAARPSPVQPAPANSSATGSSAPSSSAPNLPAANSASADAAAPRQPAARPALPPELASADIELPAETLAYADAPPVRPESANSTPAKRPLPAPHPVSAGPVTPSNAVLNSAQIASIRERLKLTSYQSQLWPPVESALRDISWQGRPEGRKVAANANGHGGTIDPDSPPVQRLKSAAFPLLMSLSEEQKQEVRTMVRLMGLESLASQF